MNVSVGTWRLRSSIVAVYVIVCYVANHRDESKEHWYYKDLDFCGTYWWQLFGELVDGGMHQLCFQVQNIQTVIFMYWYNCLCQGEVLVLCCHCNGGIYGMNGTYLMCADFKVHITAWVGAVNWYFCEDAIHNWARQPDLSWSFDWSFWPRRWVSSDVICEHLWFMNIF